MIELEELRNDIIFYILTIKKKSINQHDKNKITYEDFIDYICYKYKKYNLIYITDFHYNFDEDIQCNFENNNVYLFQKKIINYINDLLEKDKQINNKNNSSFNLDCTDCTDCTDCKIYDLRYISNDDLAKSECYSHINDKNFYKNSFIKDEDLKFQNSSFSSIGDVSSISENSKYSVDTIQNLEFHYINNEIDIYLYNLFLKKESKPVKLYKGTVEKEIFIKLFVNSYLQIILFTLYFLSNIIIFLLYDPDVKIKVSGTFLNISRKSILLIIINMAFALLTVMDKFHLFFLKIDPLFNNKIKMYQTKMLSLHKLFGVCALSYMIMHVIGHILILYNLYNRNRVCLDNKFNFEKLDISISNFRIYLTFPYISGYILLLILLLNVVIYFTKRWAVFYFFHRYSSILFIIITCLHGYKEWLGKALSWKILLPLLTYILVEKYKAYFYCKSLKVIDSYKTEKYTVLSFKRLIKDDLSYDYIFINAPKISYFEWHPFTTIHRNDDIFKLYIYNVGVWTNKLYKNIEIGDKFFISRNKKNDLCFINSFSYIVIFATGISINAFESLFNDYLNRTASYVDKMIYIIWSVNNIDIVNYYRSRLNELSEHSTNFKIMIYLTIKFDNKIDKKIIKVMNIYDVLGLNKCKLQFERPALKILLKYILHEMHSKSYINFKNKDLIAFYYSGNPQVCEKIKKKIKKYNNNKTRLKYQFHEI